MKKFKFTKTENVYINAPSLDEARRFYEGHLSYTASIANVEINRDVVEITPQTDPEERLYGYLADKEVIPTLDRDLGKIFLDAFMKAYTRG